MQQAVEQTPLVEVCGLLGGRWKGSTAYVQRVTPIANIAADPQSYFLMEPQQQIAELLTLAKGGLDLVGIYHSHPQGPLYPSETDIRDCAYPEAVYLIWWGATVAAWSMRRGRVLPVELVEMG